MNYVTSFMSDNPFLKYTQIVLGPWFLASFIMGIINFAFCFITKITDNFKGIPMIVFRVICFITNMIFFIIQVVYFFIGLTTASKVFLSDPLTKGSKYISQDSQSSSDSVSTDATTTTKNINAILDEAAESTVAPTMESSDGSYVKSSETPTIKKIKEQIVNENEN